MKTLYLILLLSFVAREIYAQEPDFLWARSIESDGFDYGNGIAVDGSGNVYITGGFTHIADFDPSTGTANHTTVGVIEIYLAKYDAAGNFLWAKTILGNEQIGEGRCIEIDGNGDILVTGYFQGTVDFDPSSGVANLSAPGFTGIFLAKYDANGNYLWAQSIGSAGGNEGECLALDGYGNVYITGRFTGTADFNPGAGTNELSSVGGLDVFFAKYDTDGNYQWAHSIGSTDSDFGKGIAVDFSNNVYLIGDFQGMADFDPGVGSSILSSTGNDVFIAKYDSDGNHLWSNSIGGVEQDFGNAVAIDANSHVFVTGYFSNTVDFNTGSGTAELVAQGSQDAFFAKYDTDGNYIWANSIQQGQGKDVTIDTDGSVYVTGIFYGSADFDPGVGSEILSTQPGGAVYFAKYGTNGDYNWVRAIQTTEYCEGNGITLDGNGNVYLTGMFEDTADFNSGTGTDVLGIQQTANPYYDIFFAKYGDVSIAQISPQITLSNGTVLAGAALNVEGTLFSPSSSVTIVFTGPSGYTSTQQVTSDLTGACNYVFPTNSGMNPGPYTVVATDDVSGLTTITQTFILNNPYVPGYFLNIQAPSEGDQYQAGQSITLTFTDLIQTGFLYPMNGSKRLYEYFVEYSDDGGANWNYITTVSGEEFPGLTIYKTVNISTNTANTYQIRVIDTYQPANNDVVTDVEVVSPSGNNIQVNKSWDHSYSGQNNTLLGVAADGTARIFLSVSKIDNNAGPAISSVEVELTDGVSSTTAHLGKVMAATEVNSYDSEANSASAISATQTNTISNGYWFWYVAPDDFFRPNQGDGQVDHRNVTANITVNYVGGASEVLQENIRIVRPPLMLVHGLGGDYGSWNDFQNSTGGGTEDFVHDERFVTVNAVNLAPNVSFNDNAYTMLISENYGTPSPYYASFHDLIRDCRAKGYAANKVDYVGHSMGGVLARTVVENFNGRYTRTGSYSNLDYKNYEQGFIHKLITISSPHNSSLLADILDRYIEELTGAMRFSMELYYLSTPNAFPFSMVQPDYNNTNLFGVPEFVATPAVRNLKIDEGDGGVNHGTTNIPSHLIAADVWPGVQTISNYSIPQPVIVAFQNAVDQLDFLDKLLNVTLAGSVDPQLTQQLSDAASLTNKVHRALKYVEIMMSAYNLLVFIPESDLVVSVESQLADYPSFGPNVSIFDDKITHCCLGNEVLDQLDVGNRVMGMLNAPLAGSEFDIIPSTSNKTTPEYLLPTAPQMAFTSTVDPTLLDIVSPTSVPTIYVDSTLSVEVMLGDTTDLVKADVSFQGQTYRLDRLEAVTTLDLQVSAFALDTQLIYVEALYKNTDTSLFVYDTARVFVTTQSTLNGFEAEPEILFLMKEQTKFPRYYAVYDEFATTVQSFSPQITATVDDPSIVQFEPKTKGFTGVADGETFATVTYQGLTDTIYLVVRRDLNDAGIVTQVSEPEIGRQDKEPLIHVYPNPSNDLITITTNQEGEYLVVMYNSIGQLLQRQSFSGATQTMSIGDYSEGIYLLEVTEKTGLKHMVKVVKQ